MQDLLVDCNPPIKIPIPIPKTQKIILLFVINITEQINIKDKRHNFIIILGPYLSSKKANITDPIPAATFKEIPNKIISSKPILNKVAA